MRGFPGGPRAAAMDLLRTFALGALAALGGALGAQQAAPPAEAPAPPRPTEHVALVGGTVHTLVPGAEPGVANLLLRDGRIEAVLAPDVALPETARRIDVAGKHVLPGLIDGMVYFDPGHDALYVAQGVTTIRDLGADPVRALLARDPAARDRVPGPFLVTAGAVIDGDPPSSSEAVILRTPEMADELLPILFNEGIDFLSVQQSLTREPFLRTVELAREKQLEVWGPVPRALSLEEALAGGLDGVLFLDRLLPEGVGWDKVLPGGLKPRVDALAASDAALVPLLYPTALRLQTQTGEEPELRLLDPLIAAQWKAELAFRKTLDDEGYRKTGERVVKKQAELLMALRAAEVPLLPGSAAPLPWLFPGKALHDELAAWEAAGIPSAEVLALATRGAAEILGLAGERGTLAPGKVADVVVVAGDPRQGVAALRAPELVVVRGFVLDRAAFDDRLHTIKKEQDAYRAELARPIEVGPPDVPAGAVVLQGLVEVSNVGQRIRAERFAVVRETDGALAYCGRTVYRGQEGQTPREMQVLQRTRDGKLDEFQVTLTNGKDRAFSHGLWVAGELRIERRLNNLLVDTKGVRNRIACVDIGSVTTALLLSQLVREEPFQVVTFHELLEPELAEWRMECRGEGVLLHLVRTHKGAFSFRNTSHGAVELQRTAIGGGSTIDTVLIEEDALGGPGLPLPPEKLALVKPAPPPADAPAPEQGGDAGGGGGGDR